MPSKGHRQGDPLSPYLFIICAEGLTSLIRQAEHCGNLHGVKICGGAHMISHLLLANYCFLFFWATTSKARVLNDILTIYGAASSQEVNLHKSKVSYSCNVSSDVAQNTTSILGVS